MAHGIAAGRDPLIRRSPGPRPCDIRQQPRLQRINLPGEAREADPLGMPLRQIRDMPPHQPKHHPQQGHEGLHERE
ncbi:MAG: hypothetical protein NT133_20315 [Alphaproteobacteria bacterium]|nr:hypothetical protein [Alphaproteobacteria bacterium]